MEEDPLAEQHRRELRKYHIEALGGMRSVDLYTKEKFNATPKTQEVFDAVNAFNFKKDNLYLCGPTGSGKSHLAAIAARRIFGCGDNLITISQSEISRRIRSSRDAEQESSRIEDFQKAGVLLIEDLGVAKDTEFMMSTLYDIINYRYQNKPGGLIITSNLNLGDLAKKFGDDRIPSRLSQICKVFNLTGEKDHRVPEKK